MSITKDEARRMLRDHSLRITAPRVAVLRVLSEAQKPLSHSEVLKILGDTDWDPTTTYRNLVKLRYTGLASVVSRAEGIDRYELTQTQGDNKNHPHFVCEDCGLVACLPSDLTASISMEGHWSASIKRAIVQLRGECPDCIRPISEDL